MEEIICSYPWPCEEALRVAWCESRLQPWADGGPNKGLFQVWVGWAPVFGLEVAELYDLEVNTRTAYAIWQREGWAPWGCRP